jgi:DsbC/DsbD-like thiol-disulfide interchange protein
MKKALLFPVLFIAFLYFGSAPADAQVVTVRIALANRTVTPGSTVQGTVSMSIPSGLHVNSSRPASEYAIPTEVRVKGTGLKTGRVTYPRGRNRKFQFSENMINVYEGRVVFPFTVTVPAKFRGKSIQVNATVRYQACTDEVCYPPSSRNVTTTAKVL